MSSPAPVAPAGGRWRTLWAIDARESFIAGMQTPAGRALAISLATLAIATFLPLWEAAFVSLAAFAAARWGQWRAALIFGATWVAALLETLLGENDTLGRINAVASLEPSVDLSAAWLAVAGLAGVLAASALALRYVRAHPKSLLARRPLVVLLVLEGALCLVLSLGLLDGAARVIGWSVVVVMTPYLWFLPYAIVDQRGAKPDTLLAQLGRLRPFWSPTYLPFGKGGSFLRRFQAATPRDLAVTQLKGLKLLAWANVLLALRNGLDAIFGGFLGVPPVGEAVAAFLRGEPLPVALSWAALVLGTARAALQIAFWAHLFIGIARLAGYRLPRGSWRPLESRTLMDYFNRFHYYFKELLVDFFFTPTFLNVFRGHPRVRMFFATFMAAGVGNALWHFIRDIHLLATLGPALALETFASYAFYCVILATGIGLSQVRASLGQRPLESVLGRVRSFAFVWSFVVCLHVFSDGSREHSLGDRLAFFASLFGVPV